MEARVRRLYGQEMLSKPIEFLSPLFRGSGQRVNYTGSRVVKVLHVVKGVQILPLSVARACNLQELSASCRNLIFEAKLCYLP